MRSQPGMPLSGSPPSLPFNFLKRATRFIMSLREMPLLGRVSRWFMESPCDELRGDVLRGDVLRGDERCGDERCGDERCGDERCGDSASRGGAGIGGTAEQRPHSW